jgi:hypothetical protein
MLHHYHVDADGWVEMKMHDLVRQDMLRVYTEDGTVIDAEVIDIQVAKSIRVKGISNKACFFFGRRVRDVCSIDYNQVTALLVGALQAMDRRIMALESATRK